ncbi:hypothetical protein GCM10010244_06070 [Streptomyces coeruleorubidus]|nr:hypothetical protein GCM10010244_06070 [Streptomyces bellus]
MDKTITLTCYACEEPFTVEYGPGRPRRYCSDSCKALARKVRQRLHYVEQAERRRANTQPF